MALTSAQQDLIVKTVVGVFDAAPGATYLNLLAPFGSNQGALVSALVNTDAFKAIYPEFYSNDQFATKFLDALVGSTVNATDKANVAAYAAGLLNGGASRANVVLALINALDNTSATDATWGAAAKAFDNQAAVAKYYSVDQLGSATSISTLQTVIAGVTNTTDVSTATAIQNAIAGSGVSATAGQTYTLTTGIDNFIGTSGNDAFIGGNGAVATSGPADQLDGGAGNDIYKMYGGATNTAFPTIKNIESVYLNATTGGLDISALAAVTALEADNVGTQTYTVTTGQAVTLSNVTTAAQTLTVAGNTPTSVGVTVNNFGQATNQETLDLSGTAAATLNLTSATASSNLALTNTGLKLATVNFAGDQAVKIDTALTSVTTINAATATGGLNINSIGASNLTFTGGSGNDRLNLAATLTAADVADGGAGTDTLAISNGATLTTAAAVGVKNFEVLEATGAAAGTLDVDTVIAKNALTGVKVSAGTSATINNINDGAVGNIVISSDAVTGGVTFTAKNFVAGGTSDTATIKLDNSVTKAADGVDVATGLTFVNLDTLNLVSLGDGTTAKTIASGNGNSVAALTAADLEKITITGDESVTLATAAATVGLTEVDASGLTGKAALSVDTSAAANISLLVKGTANVDTINTSNAATVSTTIYTGGGNDLVTLNGAATAVNTLMFNTTALGSGELKAGTDLGITLSNGAAGGQVILNFGTAIEALLKSGATVLGTSSANVGIQGTTLGVNTNVASSVAAVGGADVTTIQFDLDGDGTYVAANDAQIKITVTGVAGANDTLVYNAANDYFVFTVV